MRILNLSDLTEDTVHVDHVDGLKMPRQPKGMLYPSTHGHVKIGLFIKITALGAAPLNGRWTARRWTSVPIRPWGLRISSSRETQFLLTLLADLAEICWRSWSSIRHWRRYRAPHCLSLSIRGWTWTHWFRKAAVLWKLSGRFSFQSLHVLLL